MKLHLVFATTVHVTINISATWVFLVRLRARPPDFPLFMHPSIHPSIHSLVLSCDQLLPISDQRVLYDMVHDIFMTYSDSVVR